MSAFDPRIVLRPRTLDETVDLALLYARHHWREASRLSFFLVGGTLLYLAALHYAVGLSWGPLWAIALILGQLIERVIAAHAGAHMFGAEPTLGDSLRSIASAPLAAFIGATLIPLPFIGALATELDDELWVGVAVLFGTFWPLVLANAIFVGHSVVLEKKSLGAAVGRGRALVRGRSGRALGFVMLSGMIRCTMMISAELAASFLITTVLQLGRPIDELFVEGGSWPTMLAFLLSGPLVSLARVFDYLDARTRLEGWDIQVRFNAIADRQAERRRAA